MCIPLLTSLRASSNNGVEIVLIPLTVLIDPHQVPTGLGDPIFSISDLFTKFKTLPVSNKAHVSKVWLDGR